MSDSSIIPADVVWARGVRFHLQAVYASAGIVALVSTLGGAGLFMAGPLAKDPPITAGILALLIGGVCAAAGAVIAGVGQIRVLRAANAPTPHPLAVVEGILQRTRDGFAHLPRFALAGCVALLSAYAIWLPAGFWGAVVGTFVVIQVAALLVVIRRSLLSSPRLRRVQ